MGLRLKKKTSRGFTLFELLLAIGLFSVLVIFISIIAPTQLKKARDADRKADLEKIKIALYDYFFDKDCFPQDLPHCQEDLKLENHIYLNNFPCDAKGISYAYQVEETGCGQWFKVLTNLENLQDSGIDKVGCRSGCGPECKYNYGLSSSNIRLNDGCIAYYACSPSGYCVEYENPTLSRCPRIFENDSSCQGTCRQKENRCHDERGKRVPDK